MSLKESFSSIKLLGQKKVRQLECSLKADELARNHWEKHLPFVETWQQALVIEATGKFSNLKKADGSTYSFLDSFAQNFERVTRARLKDRYESSHDNYPSEFCLNINQEELQKYIDNRYQAILKDCHTQVATIGQPLLLT